MGVVLSGAMITVLLVEDDQSDAFLVEELLSEASETAESPGFKIVRKTNLKNAFDFLTETQVDVILLDLVLPDRQDLLSIEKLSESNPDIALVVLTGLSDEEMAVKAVEKGAQDYIMKNELAGRPLARSLRYAIERQRLQHRLSEISLVDDLTGLYNRRGFFQMAAQALKVAVRNKHWVVVMYADLDGLKEVNDTEGHIGGDAYIQAAADFLKSVFRDVDIKARIGGDEFAVLAFVSSETSARAIRKRVDCELDAFSRQKGSRPLALSKGIVAHPPEEDIDLNRLLTRADWLMYEEKRQKQTRS